MSLYLFRKLIYLLDDWADFRKRCSHPIWLYSSKMCLLTDMTKGMKFLFKNFQEELKASGGFDHTKAMCPLCRRFFENVPVRCLRAIWQTCFWSGVVKQDFKHLLHKTDKLAKCCESDTWRFFTWPHWYGYYMWSTSGFLSFEIYEGPLEKILFSPTGLSHPFVMICVSWHWRCRCFGVALVV